MKQKTAFTLVELLVVISIISLLMGILMPILTKTRQQGQNVMCLSNLRQMAMAAQVYTETFDDYYPIAQYVRMTPGRNFLYCWDFTVIVEPGKRTVVPGLLWQKQMMEEIQQCPSFRGASNTLMDPYTGYNYNTSYIGHGQGESIPTPTKAIMVKRPYKCALFGDGEWQIGANKYMRAPWPSPGDMAFTGRSAGTQGYRHLGRTNVAYCDGSVKSVQECHKGADPADIAEGTGFLSEDNSAYDLK
jgi:prepilin-type N-terminal cleavage/methylation domain-containing protein/prepilin-type processing-associated H-X9-DG protein